MMPLARKKKKSPFFKLPWYFFLTFLMAPKTLPHMAANCVPHLSVNSSMAVSEFHPACIFYSASDGGGICWNDRWFWNKCFGLYFRQTLPQIIFHWLVTSFSSRIIYMTTELIFSQCIKVKNNFPFVANKSTESSNNAAIIILQKAVYLRQGTQTFSIKMNPMYVSWMCKDKLSYFLNGLMFG